MCRPYIAQLARATAAGADKATGHRPGVLAALEDRLSGDKRRDIAIDALHEPAAVRRHVVNEFRLGEPQPVEVDQIDVGGQARREAAAIGPPEETRRLAGLALDQKLERQTRPTPPVAAPMGQHEARQSGIDDRGAMRATVA